MNKQSVFSLTLSFISLMIFWIIMSGFLTPFHLGLGVLVVSSVMYMCYDLKNHRFFDDDMNDISELRFGRAAFYIIWMIWQIIMAGFHVVKIIIQPKLPINTAMITFRADLPSAHARMILGNSITLTPGTLTVSVDGDLFTVHALDEKSYQSIATDEMPKQVLKLFSKEERQVIHDLKINEKPG